MDQLDGCREGEGELIGSPPRGFTILELNAGRRVVQYAEVSGQAVFEGDIVLGPVQQVEQAGLLQALRAVALASPAGLDGLGLPPAVRAAVDSLRAAWRHDDSLRAARRDGAEGGDAGTLRGIVIAGDRYRWEDGVVHYEIHPGLPDPDRVRRAIAHWEANTAVRFEPRRNEPDWVRFVPGRGCSSYVGRQGGPQDITLAASCSTGNVIHEIGHAVGLWHEQSRADRDAFVQIDWSNIHPQHQHNFNQHIHDGDDVDAYDYASIMHYPPGAFALDPSRPTIVARAQGVTFGQRAGLSAGDIETVERMYPSL
ncbi:M12 family metallopeptidase [Sorangium sp. So ce1099]|uniref:M12 family metallopeptidase n=1 Tax=Sorangium sp. So ce1099 TaxID=3133331 RepID=UPI003F5E99E2